MDEDDSILKSISAQITGPKSLNSETGKEGNIATFFWHTFCRFRVEFIDERSAFYALPACNKRDESIFSIMTVSLYGNVINLGSLDPFDCARKTVLRRHLEYVWTWTWMTPLRSWRIGPRDVWKAMPLAFISKHYHHNNIDTNSFVDTVIGIPICPFHHTAVITASLEPIFATIPVPAPAQLLSRTQGMVITVAQQFGDVIAEMLLLILSWAVSLEYILVC